MWAPKVIAAAAVQMLYLPHTVRVHLWGLSKQKCDRILENYHHACILLIKYLA